MLASKNDVLHKIIKTMNFATVKSNPIKCIAVVILRDCSVSVQN